VPTDSFIEALAVAPLAAANGWPILLSPKESPVPRATRNAISSLGATSALVVGMHAEIAVDQVETQVGTDSYDTAALIVRYAVTHGSTFTHTAIASGATFADALVCSAYLALDGGVLILAKDGTPPAPLLSVLSANMVDVRMLDFIALPERARQVVLEHSAGTSNASTTSTTTPAGYNGADTSGTSEPSTEGDTQTTKRPSAGGW
jgi:hypothetical protein